MNPAKMITEDIESCLDNDTSSNLQSWVDVNYPVKDTAIAKKVSAASSPLTPALGRFWAKQTSGLRFQNRIDYPIQGFFL